MTYTKNVVISNFNLYVDSLKIGEPKAFEKLYPKVGESQKEFK